MDAVYQLASLFSRPAEDLQGLLEETAAVLQTAMQHPQLTQVIIKAEGHTALLNSEGPSGDACSISLDPVEIRVSYRSDYPESPVFDHREKILIQCTAELLTDVISRVRMRKELERKHIALGEIISQIEHERQETSSHIRRHLSTFVRPYLQQLMQSTDLADQDRTAVMQLGASLDALPGEGVRVRTKQMEKLSPREMEICGLIRNGMTTKQIAQFLQITDATVERHRSTIRNKLELNNKRVSLVSYLRGIL